jgi:ubiquitin C-terminal hydrolase
MMHGQTQIKFPQHVYKNNQTSNFIKICSLEAELFNVDGQPDGHPEVRKLIVAFRNFANAPKNIGLLLPEED